jgi:hypothetical protein
MMTPKVSAATSGRPTAMLRTTPLKMAETITPKIAREKNCLPDSFENIITSSHGSLEDEGWNN